MSTEIRSSGMPGRYPRPSAAASPRGGTRTSSRRGMTPTVIARSVRIVDLRRRETVIDLGLCAAIAAYSLPPMLDPSVNDPRATVAGPLLLPTLLLPILWRRRDPFAAACALAAACVVSGIPTFDQFRLVAAIPAAILVLYTLATTSAWPRAVAGLAVVLAGLAFVGATESVLDGA